MLLDDATITRACVAIDGPRWSTFNASLFWSVRHALEAAAELPCTCQTPEAARQSERVHRFTTGRSATVEDGG
jgi:hypothetical protein